MIDVLAEIMALIRTQGHLYGRIEPPAPLGLEFPGGKGICLIVTRGACILGVDALPSRPLPGAPRDRSLRNSPGMRVRSVQA